jgi:hypothetical protein
MADDRYRREHYELMMSTVRDEMRDAALAQEEAPPDRAPRPRLVELPDGNLVNPDHVAAIESFPPHPDGIPGTEAAHHRVIVSLMFGRYLVIECESAEDARAKRSRIGAIVNGQDTTAIRAVDLATMMSVREDLERVTRMNRITLGPPNDAVNESGLHFDGRGSPVEPSPEASLPAELRPAADRPPRGGYF